MMDQELFDITDLTKKLGLGRKMITKLRDSGDLEMIPLGGKYVITRKKLDEFLEKVDSREIYIERELM